MVRHTAPASFLNRRQYYQFIRDCRTVVLGLLITTLMQPQGADAAHTQQPYYINGIEIDEHGCAVNYDGQADLFPHKVKPVYATTYTLEYYSSYKVLGVQCVDKMNCQQKYVLYHCGTTVPTINDATRFVEVPVQSVGVESTTQIPFLELLGMRNRITAISSVDFVASECVRDMVQKGVTKVTGNGQGGMDYDQVRELNVLVSFTGTFGSTPPDAPGITFNDAFEVTALGHFEFVYYTAAFFNAEFRAKTVVSEAQERIDCHVGLVAGKPIQRVAWVAYNPVWGWHSKGKCPSYYCDHIRNARGIPITPITDDASIQAAISQADVWIMPDAWTDETKQKLEELGWPQTTATWRNQRIFATDGSHPHDWFEGRLAEPDVIFEDIVVALHPDVHTKHTRVWLRNVFTESAGTKETRCLNHHIPLVPAADGCPIPSGELPCKPLRALYSNGQALCERMWGTSFRYEPVESLGYTMWWFDKQNPNDDVTTRLGMTPLDRTCRLDSGHLAAPAPAEWRKGECQPWMTPGGKTCCPASTTSSVDVLRDLAGPGFHWDRCGSLSPACERFFVQHACFYQCSPHIGLFQKHNDAMHANVDWEIHGMPIKASYCDAWWSACREDLVCATPGGDRRTCARNPPSPSPTPSKPGCGGVQVNIYNS